MKTDLQLTPHFNLKEFLHNGSDEGLTPSIVENLRKLANELESIREHFGKPITINSGFRTVKHNAAVGGEKNSFHTKGMAADIVVSGVPPGEVQKHLKDWRGGLGSYAGFTHIDIRPYKARW